MEQEIKRIKEEMKEERDKEIMEVIKKLAEEQAKLGKKKFK